MQEKIRDSLSMQPLFCISISLTHTLTLTLTPYYGLCDFSLNDNLVTHIFCFAAVVKRRTFLVNDQLSP